jgi:hypothetical protein
MPLRDPYTAVLNNAGSQRDRWLPPLRPGYARADDRSLEELLGLAVRLAPLINYYGDDDTVHGDWSEFFLRDPIFVLASMTATNVGAMERALAVRVREIRAERSDRRKRELLDELLVSALALPRQVGRWLRALEDGADSRSTRLAHRLIAADIRDQLMPHLQVLEAWDGPTDTAAPRADSANIDSVLPRIVAAWQPVADAVARWAAEAPSQIAAAVKEADGRQRPHVALFVAFAHLLGIAQESLNDFAGRRADFYLRRVLRDHNRKAIPDSVYVALEPAAGPATASVGIPRGTQLPAGKDSRGRDQTFVSCDDVTVTGATLAAIRTVRILDGPLLPHDPTRVIQRIVSREMTRDAANATGFAAFGCADDESASIGFVVGAPALWLRAGRRTITLDIGCAPLPAATSELLTRLNLTTGLDDDQILERLLQGAFVLGVSSSAGWQPVDAYSVEWASGPNGGRFRMRFTVAADAPALEPIAGSPLTGEWPAVRVLLRQKRVALDDAGIVTVYPLSVLAGLAVTSADVAVEVEQMVPAEVANPIGRVDPRMTFPAFGAVPAVGSFLTIREPELYAKAVSALTLRMDWFTLPADETGFKGYYRGYVIGPNGLPQEKLFDNQVFRAVIGNSEHFLFRTPSSGPVPEPEGRLTKQSVFYDVALPPADTTGDPAWRNAFRIELTAPPYGFGHGIYAQNALHAAAAPPATTACDASCRAEYGFLLQAARHVETVLPPLTQSGWRGRLVETTRSFRGLRTRARAVGSNTAATLDTLADAACESLAACLAEWKELFPADRQIGWREHLAACRRGHALDRFSTCEALQSTLRSAALTRGGVPESSHLQRCELILGVALWVRDSDDGYSDESEWHYRRTIRANLTKCIAELRARYDDAVKTCIAECTNRRLQFRPNPPHFPQIESLSFDYTSEGPATFFAHLMPFEGHRRLQGDPQAGFGTLLPRFAHEGNLYLGCSGMDEAGTWPLYVRIGPSQSPEPLAIVWSYLAADKWFSLPSGSRDSDPSGSFQASGMVTLAVPARDETGTSSLLPGSLRWIRASIDGTRDGPQILGIYLHAVKATRYEDGKGGGGFEQPLPPRTIVGLAKPVRGIALVTQPAGSFGGRAAESDRDFQVRCSERLRHKDRAVLGWDYERIVLEQFPTVWKVRVLPARAAKPGEQEVGPGIVRVVVVPGPGSPDVPDPAVPTSGAETRAAIARVLQKVAGPFVRVRVLDPIFVRARVSATIRWREGQDPRISADRLVAELKTYLSPWENDVRGDRGVSEPELAEFVQSRSYVDLLSSMVIAYDGAAALASEPERCLLTTASTHEIHGEVLAFAAVQESN